MSAIHQHHRLVTNLEHRLSQQAASDSVQLIETHISSVILAGGYAYKIKKPVDLGFLDFSTLERRRNCCQEEIRLNSRLAADLYLDVVGITGTIDNPSIGTEGEAIEYAVRMRRFPDGTLLSEQPECLDEELADELAQQLAAFHASIDLNAAPQPYGTPAQVLSPMQENFDQIRALTGEFDEILSLLQAWTMDEFQRLQRRLVERRAEGFIRECHGDLHLGNIALAGDRLILFDGIEFNPALRWIDTMSELAFLLMDIEEKGLIRIARQLLDSYLQISGDYQGLDLLRFYQLYRAMVRAKVLAIRLHQADASEVERSSLRREFSRYLENAMKYTGKTSPSLLITHGLSGSGKSVASGKLLKSMSLIRVRSDVERKRLAGLTALARSGAPSMHGIYTPDFSEKTYARLLSLAESLVRAGYAVVVDAAFLKSAQRRCFAALASELEIPFLILDFQVPQNELRKRVAARNRLGLDPSEADLRVLNGQILSAEQLSAAERQYSIVVNQASDDETTLVRQIRHRLGS